MGKIWMPGGGGGADLDVITAGAGDVLAGKVIVDKDGEPLTGTIADRGNWTGTVGMNGEVTIPGGKHGGSGKVTGPVVTLRGAWTSRLEINGRVTIPKGFHDGNGYVDQALATKAAATYTPGTANQTIAANQWLSGAQTIKGDGNLAAGNIIKGKSIFGVAGSAFRSEILNYTAYDGNISYTGYSDTAGNRSISLGSPYSEWDTVVMQIKAVTSACGPVCITLSKGKQMRVPVTTIKYNDSQYQNAWLSISRSSSGTISVAPFRGNASGTYRTLIQIFAVFDGIVNNEA